MFSLIIAIIAIALVVLLTVLGTYHLGGTVNQAAAQSEASRLKNEEQQILAAVDMFRADHATWPRDVEELVSRGYLTSLPKGPISVASVKKVKFVSAAYAADISGWGTPLANEPIYTSLGSVSKEVCQAYNLASRGDDGILVDPYTALPSQCYGADGSYRLVFYRAAPHIPSLSAALAGARAGALPAPGGSDTAGWDTAPSGAIKVPVRDPQDTGEARLAATPPTLSFGEVTVGEASGPRTITLSNVGDEPLTGLALPTAPAGLTQTTSNCGATLAPGASCTVGYTLQVQAQGPYSQTMHFSGQGSSSSVAVSANGLAAAALSCSVAGGNCALAFSPVQVAQSQQLGPVTLTNTGGSALQALATNLPADFAVQNSTCGVSLAPGASCNFSLRYTPTKVGAASSSAVLTAQGVPSVELSLGSPSGVAPKLEVVAGAGGVQNGFNVTVPRDSASGAFIFYRNTGVGPVTLADFTATGLQTSSASAHDDEEGSYCWPGRVLAPGSSCRTYVFANTTASGAGTLASTAGSVVVSGTINTVGVVVSSQALSSVSAGTGLNGNVSTVTLSNPTSAYFHFPRRASGGALSTLGRFTGSDAANFAIASSTCGTKVAPGASCAVTVSLNNASAVRAYSAVFEFNGGFQQVQPGSSGDWSPGQWFVSCEYAACDVYQNVAKTTVTGTVGIAIVDKGGYRTYSDNTMARSCLAYLQPTDTTYAYQGATGNGVYRVKPTNGAAMDVYCDMTTQGGGWALIFNKNAGATSTETTSVISPTSPNYWPLSRIQALVYQSGYSQVMLLDRNNNSIFARSKTAAPLTQLLAGRVVNNPADPVAANDWVLSLPANATMNYSCAGSSFSAQNPYPYIYWACNQNNGLHLSNTIGAWAYSDGVQTANIGVWVR